MGNRLRWCAIAVGIVGATLSIQTQGTPPPILLVVNSSAPNPYGPYLAEILKAEGLNAFSTKQLSALTATDLTNSRLVVLAETALTDAQATLFSNYVGGGGRLVAMRPDSKLAGVLGLIPGAGSTSEGYIGINNTTLVGEGFPATTLPFHGSAQQPGLLSGATSIATLYSNQTTPTGFPAVVRYGNTVTWTYDLARSVVYSRQGNPANAGVERDGLPPIRTVDLFYNAIDRDRVQIPHADIQMRLLARLIEDMLADVLPMPRLWYFPSAVRTMMVLTGDAHANPQSYFDQVIASVEAFGGRISLYVTPGSAPDAAHVATWRAAGHEVGMHPSSYPNPMLTGYQTNSDFFDTAGLAPTSPTVRNHFVEWLGWVGAAQIAQQFNIGLETSFYTWGPAVTYPDGRQAHGYITGSGLPMKFIDTTGAVIPVYQQVTSLVDEQLAVGDFSEHLTPEQSLVVSRQLIDESQAGGYSAITTQFHVDYYQFGEVKPWAEGTMDYARSLGLPMWTAERWLNFNTARAGAAISAVAWSAGPRQLSFQMTVPASNDAQSVALPYRYAGFGLTNVTIDGSAAPTTQQVITGRQTNFVSVGAGSHVVVATYTTPVPPPQHPPVANNDTASTTEGTAVTIPVLANDVDIDGDPLTVTSVSGSGGVVVINPNQTLSYTPNAGTCGPDTFTYTIDDGRGGADTATVTVNVTCVNGGVTDTTGAQFLAACALPSGAIATQVGGGEIRLAGTQGDEYSQGTLNAAQWTAGLWAGGSFTPTISGGILSITAGRYVRSNAALPLTTLEATARFTNAPWQHLGWGSLDFAGGYAIFSTFSGSSTLYARTNDGSGEQMANLGVLPSGFHTYRIERQSLSASVNQVSYYIDGVLRAQHTVGALSAMYVYQTHNGGGTGALDIDRLWVYPSYVPSGTFQSCTLDIGHTLSSWSTAQWDATVPAGTTFQLRTRTSTNGTTWSGWSVPLLSSGQDIQSPAGRYLQYKLELTSSTAAQSPVVTSVTMNYRDNALPPQHAPIAVSDVASTLENNPVTIAVKANDVDPDGDPLTLVSTTQPAKGTVVINANQTVTYTPTAGACGADSFTYSISDGRGGTGGAAVALNVACVTATTTHTTVADYGACALPTGTLVTAVTDGEIRLAGTQGDEYNLTVLNGSLWTAGAWSGGAFTPGLSAGNLSVATDGFVRSNTALSVTTLDATARFAAAPWQHLGWGSLDFAGGYAIFSTYNTSGTLFARTNGGGGEVQTNLGPVPAGFHAYRVERQSLSPTTDQVSYFIDGVLQVQHTTTPLTPMHVYQSNNSGGTATLDIDRLWVYPAHVASGSFQSCTIDGGAGNSSWLSADWNAIVPAGTSLQVRTRTSSDGTSWSGWSAPLAGSGSAIASPPARYLQYLLELATSDANASPIVNSVTVRISQNGVDATPPSLSGVTATGITAGSATINWTTSNEVSTSRVEYGPAVGYAFSTPLNGTMTQAHSVLLTGLTASTLYHYRVASRDAAGNEALSSDFTFTTPAPTIAISDAADVEGNSATKTFTFNVSLSAPSSQTVTVAFATAAGTAAAPGDFGSVAGTLTYSPGEMTQAVSVTVNGDTLNEANETFVVNLSGATNAVIVDSQGVGTISNDDAPPTISISDAANVTEGSSGTQNARFTVSLSAASGQAITVAYATANGTAVSPGDYSTRTGTLNFAAGTTQLFVDVPVVGDTTPEADETFVVNLSSPTVATLADAQGAVTILDTDGTVQVTSPNTGVSWAVGSIRTITWTHNLGVNAPIRLELSRDGGTSWELISASVASSGATSGSFNWTITGPTTSSARIRATWTVNAEATDTSNSNFTLETGTLQVQSPNNNSTTWTAGTNATITWSGNLTDLDNVRIELSLNGGSTYPITILASTPSDGTQTVAVQNSWRTNSARVRITWVNNAGVSDTSNSNFRIQ